MNTIEASYEHCRRVAAGAASNFYLAFWLLPEKQHRAMCSLYAFLRRSDDLGDSDRSLDERRWSLRAWRSSLAAALAGEYDDPIWPALIDTMQRYEIPHSWFEEVLDGIESDLGSVRIKTYEELSLYCHRVAGVVGKSCLQIWGYSDRAALELADDCGRAFQLTNILRDLADDLEHDRVYLPAEDFARFGCTPDDLRGARATDELREMLRFEVARAKEYFAATEALGGYLSRDGRRVLQMMVETYRCLLSQLDARDGDLIGDRIEVGWWNKLWILGRSLFVGEPHRSPPRNRKMKHRMITARQRT